MGTVCRMTVNSFLWRHLLSIFIWEAGGRCRKIDDTRFCFNAKVIIEVCLFNLGGGSRIAHTI